jgi:hypothetical protein
MKLGGHKISSSNVSLFLFYEVSQRLLKRVCAIVPGTTNALDDR